MKYNIDFLKKGNYSINSICLFLLILFACPAHSQSLTVGGSNWTVSIPTITEAGNNYAGSYESATNQILLTASVPLLLGNAKVSARYIPDPIWNNSLVLNIKRTGNGTTVCLLCTITGGTTYQTITQTDIEIFRIAAVLALASYNNIPLQLQLTGVSVTIPAASYGSRIVFTISGI
ncbi:hypothetical protein [Chryseobacterium paridis]|uniref:Uncharacterized protein n=1 Tax=Chryseobacterium paridis TaxID=2800328 RepID=A0ABS1G0U9_9FLAO|nr:hypothetical protein [Chryseobacterium paridis]MBK1898272.1 hypothetical protein [Chryseobacterium paridis]